MNEVKFYLEKRMKNGKLITERVPLFASFSYKRNRLVYYTGKRIDFDNWDINQSKMKKGTSQGPENASEINSFIQKVSSVIIHIYKKYEVLGLDLPLKVFLDEIKTELNQKTASQKGKVLTYFEQFIAERNHTLQPQTIKSWEAFKKKLQKVGGNINEVGPDYYKKFANIILEKGQNSSLKQYLQQMRTFTRWLSKKGLLSTQAAEINLKFPELSSSDRFHQNLVALSFPELKAIEKLKELPPKLVTVRDIFIFCCNTGIRFSDLSVITKDSIKNNELHYTSLKNKKRLIVPLNKKAISIAEKYKKQSFSTLFPPQFPNQYNERIRDLAKLAKLNDNVTFVYWRGTRRTEIQIPKHQAISAHTSRKTFIVNSIELGINPLSIMTLVGHSDFSTFKKYYSIRADKLREEISKFDKPKSK